MNMHTQFSIIGVTVKINACNNITINSITVNAGSTLKLEATEKITIGADVTVQAGAKLELEAGGKVSIDYGTFKVMEGATFIIK